MALTDIGELPSRGRVLVDSTLVIYFLYFLEGPRELAPRYAPFLERAGADDYDLIVTTVTLAEVLTGPLRTGTKPRPSAQRCRSALTAPPTWRLVDLTAVVAHRAARVRARSKLRLPDAVRAATAPETSSIGLVTRDRDFSSFAALPERVPVYG